MLLTHTKLVLGNNITYMSAYNYFSAVPMVLLMELKIINDADKYLDKYIEMVRENDTDGILYTDSIFNNPKSMIVFGEYLWLMFIREYRKMNDYQKSYCFWRYLEYTKDNIANALTYSFKEIEMDEDYDINIEDGSIIDLSKIYGSESRKLREKYLKRYLKYPKSKGDTYPRLEGNSIQRFKELYDFHFEYFKKGLYYSKEETHFYLTVPYSVLCEPILDNFRGIYENNAGTLWQVEGNNFIQSKITMDVDHEKLMLRREYATIFGKGGLPKTIDHENVSIVYFNPDEAHIMKALKQQMASRQYFRINGNYYTADGRSYIQQGVDTNLTNDSSITTRYTYNDYYSLYSTNSSATFGYDSTVSNINSSYNDYEDMVSYLENNRSEMRSYATRILGERVPNKKKKKTRKIDSKFIKSYTFLTKVLSLDHIKQMRKNNIKIPIIVVSARNNEDEIVESLNVGADDYIVKPFYTKELIARISSALRRVSKNDDTSLIVKDNFQMDIEKVEFRISNIPIHLTPIEFNLLRFLMQNSGKVLTHTNILRNVWGINYQNDTKILRVFINQLRKKIEKIEPIGGQVEITAENIRILFGDGVNARYLPAGEKIPEKHQLLIEFDDNSCIVCTVQMYGVLHAFTHGENDNFYYHVAKTKPSPLSKDFDISYFEKIISDTKPTLSVKALLATEQRIPGFGNGILQDILFFLYTPDGFYLQLKR